MTPTALQTLTLMPPRPQRGRIFTSKEPQPETQVPACPRVRVADLPDRFLKPNHISGLEQNQKIPSCCRHPENHEVEALKSHADEQAPDIYIFHCGCGRRHRFFCVGLGDERPVWDTA